MEKAGASIKIRPDTLAVLAALRGRFGSGHSYDNLIQELVRREIEGTASAAQAGERLKRCEEMLIRLIQKADDDASGSTPPNLNVK